MKIYLETGFSIQFWFNFSTQVYLNFPYILTVSLRDPAIDSLLSHEVRPRAKCIFISKILYYEC